MRSPNAPSRVRAVVIGVSEYRHEGIADLQFAHRDAEAFAEFLLSGEIGPVAPEDVRLLTNANAKGGDVEAALNWLAELSQQGDRAIIFFSGHGENERMMARSSFLLCHDAIPRNVLSSGVLKLTSLQEVIAFLSSKGTDVLLVADACRAGGLLDRSSAMWVGQDFGQRMAKETMLLSCRPGEQSHEGPQWDGGHGVFTHMLLQGVRSHVPRDGSGRILFKDMERFLQDTLPKLVFPLKQIPLTDGDPTKVVFQVRQKARPGESSGRLDHPQELTARNALDRAFMENADTGTLRTYKQFLEALASKNFFSPAGSCADDMYTRLISNEDLVAVHGELTYSYAIALQNDAQEALNLLLAAEPRELSMVSKEKKEKYANYPRQLSRAADILGRESAWQRALQAREALFRGMLVAINARSSKSQSTANEAKDILTEAQALEPENATVAFYLMILHAEVLKDEESSRRYYLQCKDLAPRWTLPDVYWGHFLAQVFKHPEEAEMILDEVSRKDSTHYFLYMARGSIRFAQKRYEDAIQDFHQLLRIYPGHYLTWNNIALSYRELGRSKDARQAAEKSLAIEPRQKTAYITLGQILQSEEDFMGASENFGQALTIDPNDARALRNLGLCQLALKQWEELEASCQRMAIMSPDDYLPHYLRAAAAFYHNDLETLCRELRRAFELGMKREDIHIDEILKMLETEQCMQGLGKR